jgi:hypothetical protein
MAVLVAMQDDSWHGRLSELASHGTCRDSEPQFDSGLRDGESTR